VGGGPCQRTAANPRSAWHRLDVAGRQPPAPRQVGQDITAEQQQHHPQRRPVGQRHASKWGLLGLSHALHTECRRIGIKVSAVIAGGMRTPFILDRFPDTPLENLQPANNVAAAVKWVLEQPEESVVPEVMVLPMGETSWP
jgi:NAD(P)-dependent dehydrogenase (short-subunit alcohol dehydrogenase family)